MKNFLIKAISEDDFGKVISSQRVTLFLMLILTIIIIGFILFIAMTSANILIIQELTWLISVLLGIGIVGKVTSKFAEREVHKE